MSDKVLVFGAGGNIGAPLVETLLARGVPVRAASRSGAAPAGAEGVVVDLAEPSTVPAAFDGVGAAFIMLPAGSVAIAERLLPAVQAAAERGVKVVLLSVLGAETNEANPYRQVELALIASGVKHVILRPNWFSDNFHTYWKAGVDAGVISVPAGEGRSSFVDVRDIAASAAAALTSDAFDGQGFSLTGPQALSYAEAAKVLSGVVGRPVAYRAVDDDAFIGALTGAGVPDDYAHLLTAIFAPVREGWTAAVSDDVERLTGRPAIDLATYARDHAADLGA